MRISMGYSDSEDRMWIRTEASNVLWWMTRRLALRLIAQWAQLLERSVEVEGAGDEAGEGQGEGLIAARRRQALRDEYAHAVAAARGEQKVAPVERPAPGVALENCLLASVDLSANARGARLVLKAPGRSETLTMSRSEAHRLLDALFGRCSRLGWYGAKLPAWLVEDAKARARPAQ